METGHAHDVLESTIVYHSKHAKIYGSCNWEVYRALEKPQINESNSEFKPCFTMNNKWTHISNI